MEIILAGSLIGAGLLFNNKQETSKEKVSPNIPNNKNIYETNFNKLESTDKKLRKVRFDKALQRKDGIFTDNISRKLNIDSYDEKNPATYMDRPESTRVQQNDNIEHFDNSVSSLTGEKISLEEFTHNNMVPFFGSNVKQNMDMHANQNKLETFTGVMSNDIKKEEIAPLFKPEKNLGNVYGSQVTNDRERYVESKYTPFVHPIESIKVGPGLNQGYSSKPTGGYQDPEIRNIAMPKTVDELRTLNNPKLTYKGTIIPGKKISKPSMMGKLDKTMPDTYYVNNPDRYNTTVGAHVKPKLNPKITLEVTNRQETNKEYSGIAGPVDKNKHVKRGTYQKSKNHVLPGYGYRNLAQAGDWSEGKYDYGKSGVVIPSTEREVTQFRTHSSNVSSLVKSIIAPIQDLIQPTKKENAIGNLRQTGNVSMPGPEKQTVYDPNDIARTTIKETNIHNNRSGNMNGPQKLSVYDPDDIAKTTIKETNIHDNRTGNMAGPRRLTVHDPDDNARTTIKETNIHDNRLGNLKSVKEDGYAEQPGPTKVTLRNTLENVDFHANLKGENNNTIYDPNDIAKTTIKETNIHNERSGNINTVEKNDGYLVAGVDAPITNRQFTSDVEYVGDANKTEGDGYLVTDVQVPDTNKQFTSDVEYTGVADSINNKEMSYADIYNATLNELKEGISEGREPTQTSVKIPLGEDSVCMTTSKEQLRNVKPEMTRIVNLPPDMLQYDNMTTEKGSRPEENNKISDRINPEMLDAFKKNPLTQSLASHSFP